MSKPNREIRVSNLRQPSRGRRSCDHIARRGGCGGRLSFRSRRTETPEGGHWYYRIDRATKRHCWYLRERGRKLSQTAAPKRPPSAKPVAPKADAAMQRSIADARAELPAQTRVEQPGAATSATAVSAACRDDGQSAWEQTTAPRRRSIGSLRFALARAVVGGKPPDQSGAGQAGCRRRARTQPPAASAAAAGRRRRRQFAAADLSSQAPDLFRADAVGRADGRHWRSRASWEASFSNSAAQSVPPRQRFARTTRAARSGNRQTTIALCYRLTRAPMRARAGPVSRAMSSAGVTTGTTGLRISSRSCPDARRPDGRYFSSCRCNSRTNVVKPVRRSRFSRSALRIDCTSANASSIS